MENLVAQPNTLVLILSHLDTSLLILPQTLFYIIAVLPPNFNTFNFDSLNLDSFNLDSATTPPSIIGPKQQPQVSILEYLTLPATRYFPTILLYLYNQHAQH